MAMAAGYALHEEIRSKDGRITTLNLNVYRIPRSTDLPEMRAIIVENPDPQITQRCQGARGADNRDPRAGYSERHLQRYGKARMRPAHQAVGMPEELPEEDCRL